MLRCLQGAKSYAGDRAVVSGCRRRRGGAYVSCAVSGGCHGGPPLHSPPSAWAKTTMLNAKVDDQAAKGLAKHEPTRGGSQIQWKRKAKGNSRRRLLSMMLAIPSRAGGGRGGRRQRWMMAFAVMRMGDVMDDSPTALWWW